MIRRVATFALLCFGGGLGGLVGSILGHAFGQTGLWIGGVVGGVILAPVAAWIAGKLGWIAPPEVRGTAIGAAAGFLLAAFIATHTLSSPVGPVLSTLLIGFGGLAGGRLLRR